VARGYAGDSEHLSNLIQAGFRHKGFSLIDILQPCVTFNTVNTYDWYKKRVYDLNAKGHRTKDFIAAITAAREWGDKIPIGIFYQKEKPTFTDQIAALQKGPLIAQAYTPKGLQALLSNQ